MKYLIIFWGIPVGFLVAWYSLSYNDINFGIVMLSRPFNDLVFDVYANILGITADEIRAMLIKTLIIDTIFVAFVVYFKPFSKIKNFIVAQYQRYKSYRAAKNEAAQEVVLSESENSLSSAP